MDNTNRFFINHDAEQDEPLVTVIEVLCNIAGIYRGTENITLEHAKDLAEMAINELSDTETYGDLVMKLLPDTRN